MCGILTLARPPQAGPARTEALARATRLARHRGPDDEGYLLWRQGGAARIYAGAETGDASRRMHGLETLPDVADWQVAFGHRRLSIIDLSPAGHQPMLHAPSGLAISFNGELYNYLELREELSKAGHEFHTQTDTEVILVAWAAWGPECLHRFNGMFAFSLLDTRAGALHLARDRFGVKPLYWTRLGEQLAFASEIKQLRALPGFAPQIDQSTARDYLATGWLDHSRHTFDENIQRLSGGERAVVRLDAPVPAPEVIRWYELKPEAWRGADAEAPERCRELLRDSVRLRLRSDVPLGTCLSGGLDSSAIVCLIKQLQQNEGLTNGQRTVTVRYDNERFDEWPHAAKVIAHTGADPVQIWPTVERLQSELDQILWHLDEPHGSTSQFNQWCVFGAAAGAGLKVMLDGQGGDEQLAGYGGSTVTAMLAGLLRRGRWSAFVSEVNALRQKNGRAALAQALLATRNLAPAMDYLLPADWSFAAAKPLWLRLDAPTRQPTRPPRDLTESLQRQILFAPLSVHLRYEDRLSSAWSVESRLPFLDYRLVEFLLGLPERLKLRGGRSKVVLREALRGVIPEEIRERKDKMGFVAPEPVWLRGGATDWFKQGVEAALDIAPEFFHADETRRMVNETVSGQRHFSMEIWRILCLGRWLKSLSQ
jgi:asparagine synthase (glutamine-hydrolysing)